ncbi:calcium-binding protein [Campylobacter blaseri]|uniref:Haemolysin-type calcium binding-related domain-containing protein n=1 Tax=Campylobacter blaseri TaxID=2042961 RepID=A0A2P8R2P7_9BACT|nr:hypothetical protein CQ405_02875 [Campylobacter blaseri]PSM54434.1 hypothetical protein CRN67_02875 [Campylobacter blaseri]
MNPNEIKLSRKLVNLVIEFVDKNRNLADDKITIQNYFNILEDLGNGVIEKIKFKNSTIWDLDTILKNFPLLAIENRDINLKNIIK